MTALIKRAVWLETADLLFCSNHKPDQIEGVAVAARVILAHQWRLLLRAYWVAARIADAVHTVVRA